MVKVQIAGIKTIKEAQKCASLGADAIGLLVGQSHTSDDFISPELAKEIVSYLPLFVDSVLITHLEEPQQIIDLISFIGVQTVQLHSYIRDNEVKFIKKALPNIKIIRLIHIDEQGKILHQLEQSKIADAYITDSINRKNNQFGGTGLAHNFETDKMLAKKLKKPLILAGGLTTANVRKLVKYVKPYAVDSNTGTKGVDGYRDLKLVKTFIKESKRG